MANSGHPECLLNGHAQLIGCIAVHIQFTPLRFLVLLSFTLLILLLPWCAIDFDFRITQIGQLAISLFLCRVYSVNWFNSFGSISFTFWEAKYLHYGGGGGLQPCIRKVGLPMFVHQSMAIKDEHRVATEGRTDNLPLWITFNLLFKLTANLIKRGSFVCHPTISLLLHIKAITSCSKSLKLFFCRTHTLSLVSNRKLIWRKVSPVVPAKGKPFASASCVHNEPARTDGKVGKYWCCNKSSQSSWVELKCTKYGKWSRVMRVGIRTACFWWPVGGVHLTVKFNGRALHWTILTQCRNRQNRDDKGVCLLDSRKRGLTNNVSLLSENSDYYKRFLLIVLINNTDKLAPQSN